MTEKRPYTYTVLKYVHDIVSGESLNVGIVLHSDSGRFLKSRTRSTYRRIKEVFPDLDSRVFRTSMKSIERAIAHLAQKLPEAPTDALGLARSVMVTDESALQWSVVGSGVTTDLEGTLDKLYARFVTRYDTKIIARRTDEDVWRPVRDKLTQRGVDVPFEEKVITGNTDEISFKHAWKNGRWHAYQPVSLDLADAEGIKDKARRWRGHLDAVADGHSEDLKIYFIVGAPQDSSLLPAFDGAVGILRNGSFDPEVFEEAQVDDFVNKIEDEVRAHDHSRRPRGSR